MEVLRSWGLEQRILDGADDVEMALLETVTAAAASEGTRFDVGYPTTAQSSVVSPTRVACVAQDHLEAVLLDHLAALPAATVRRGVEAIGVRTVGAHAELTLEDGSGARRTVLARQVVAADGVRSRMRRALGIEMVGRDGIFHGAMVEFRAPLWDVLGEHRYGVYSITHPDGSGVLLPAGQGDRWLFAVEWDQAARGATEAAPEQLRRHIEAASGAPGIDLRIERVAWFSTGAQVAERFGDGRVLVVGDAAHRVTPRGGTGLNTAFASGRDLGWKLGWVLQGWAGPELLATYEGERRPQAEHNVARSADPFGSRREVITELQVDLAGRIRHEWLDEPDASGPRRSTLDLLGDGLTLFTGPDASTWSEAAHALAARVPVALTSFSAVTARALGISRHGALLVRPDGLPVAGWSSSADAAARLSEAVTAFTGLTGLTGTPTDRAGSRRDAA
jgi:2-polyprenyl-6-methoxyphenol hydroxylase-like FAD-dependent oxidoreductase